MGSETPAVGKRACPELAPLKLSVRAAMGGWVGRWDRDLRGWAGRGGVRRTLNVWYLFFLQLVEILMFTV